MRRRDWNRDQDAVEAVSKVGTLSHPQGEWSFRVRFHHHLRPEGGGDIHGEENDGGSIVPAPSSEPLQKLSLNLYAADVLRLKSIYGPGYQTEVRNIVRRFICQRAATQAKVTEPYIAEDFDE